MPNKCFMRLTLIIQNKKKKENILLFLALFKHQHRNNKDPASLSWLTHVIHQQHRNNLKFALILTRMWPAC